MARTIPTAVFAKGARSPGEGGQPGLGHLPHPNAGGFVTTPSDNIAPESIQRRDGIGVAAASPEHLYELALTTTAMAFHSAAIQALRECTTIAPDHGPAWRKLAQVLRLAREDGEAAAADAAADRAESTAGWRGRIDRRTPAELEKAEARLREPLAGKAIKDVAATLRAHLIADPLDAAAMRVLARVEMRLGDPVTCLRLLERALDVSPDYLGALESYAEALLQRWQHAGIAVAQTARLIAYDPRNSHYRYLHAYATMQTGDLETTIELLVGLLREQPAQAGIWLSYGQALQFLGRREESVQAFRRCLELQPEMGQAYLGLAELRGKDITESDVAAMRAQLAGTAMPPDSRPCMLYALAQTLERAGDFAASFAAYEEGSRLVRANAERRGPADSSGDSADPTRVGRLKAVFSRENLETKLVQAPAPATPEAPIFVIGLPRAGSTLVEQVLASHSQVEGTRELPVMEDIVSDLMLSRIMVMPNAYPECILDLTRDQLAALGARYIEESRAYRQTQRPRFVDKRTWNWMEAGLIHLILPQAKVIDIRREPMAACFAMYKQLLADFAYDLDGLGRYYRKYVGMMDHWESVLPGRIHFVQYERLVTDTESEIRRMLAYCGLPFEEGCLRFWETDRTVSTPSAEQVRRPIYRDAVEAWRNFEPWLGPLKASLAEPAPA
ncbi:MAG TPA: sulfotransferase [Rhizomicrobium sp.]|jgi:tetratricopeptide (TPR) repeat protein|nr:sulfotransferase [Rhizomicrobium sp.]